MKQEGQVELVSKQFFFSRESLCATYWGGGHCSWLSWPFFIFYFFMALPAGSVIWRGDVWTGERVHGIPSARSSCRGSRFLWHVCWLHKASRELLHHQHYASIQVKKWLSLSLSLSLSLRVSLWSFDCCKKLVAVAAAIRMQARTFRVFTFSTNEFISIRETDSSSKMLSEVVSRVHSPPQKWWFSEQCELSI